MNKMYQSLVLCTFLLSTAASEDGWFWHVTDFHWDFSYWTDQLSCNGMNISAPGQFGDQWCDSSWELVAETIKGLPVLKSHVDFILWTGDTVPHVSDTHLNNALNEELVRNVTMLMSNTFPNTPVVPTFGNHDYYPNGQYPPHGNIIYNDTLALWKWWINDVNQEADFLKGGYYTVSTAGLRVIALNTNLYYTSDHVTPSIDDPADQFSWLDDTLTKAAAANEKIFSGCIQGYYSPDKNDPGVLIDVELFIAYNNFPTIQVIITGHVPPGFTTPRAVRWMTQTFNEKFNHIIHRHSAIIKALHFGHEHHDNFRLYYDDAGRPIVSLFIGPSVTPWRYQIASGTEPAHNPGVRLIKYDKKTGNQLDIIQYYIDLDESNAKGSIVWKHGYNATSLYKIPDIGPSSMHDLVTRMGNSSSDEFLAYVNWYNTNGSPNFPCAGMCHKAVMCGFRYLEELSFKTCLTQAQDCFGDGSCFIG